MTNKQTNRLTKWGVESCSTRLKIYRYLVACTQLYTPLCLSLTVGQSVGWLVGRSVTFYFFYDSYFWTSLLLPKWSSDLKYGPCPPARDWGSRVSGLV